MIIKFIPLSVLLVLSMVSVGEEFPGIKQLMTDEEFSKAGLEKQTEAELEVLNQWLIRYTAIDARSMRKNVDVKAESDKDIHSRIVGEFSGWDGKTIFRLENGQVWKQRLNGKWRTKLSRPDVIVSKNIFGFYKITVVAKKKSIGVKRVK